MNRLEQTVQRAVVNATMDYMSIACETGNKPVALSVLENTVDMLQAGKITQADAECIGGIYVETFANGH